MDEHELTGKKKDKLKQNYRLVILDDETLQEVSTYKLSLLNLYMLLSSVFVLLGLIIILLFVFTPLKTFLPGYGDVEANKQFIELTQKTEELENDILAMNEYLERSKTRLVGTSEGDSRIESFDENPSNIPINLDLDQEYTNRSPKKIVNKAKLGQYYLLTPLLGPISAEFDPNRKHFGVDILGPKNSAVKAIMDGYVISSDWTLESGNTIAIQHANNIVSFYKHNSSLLKKAGSFVQAGEAIAIIGNSGTLSDGPHLHFELWYNGHPVNPTEFINF
ncbi:M23 family metallopeptidase [Portibacter lacus]|uniref:Peptidase M23 n=1 Tax=Portibacter lacus TaxID=1099794 RepID=A0AA37STN1_9BACT|nr:M23 family metallopeptidase [Portibacter lacus]GLR18621.1 peptidase M23 [Portibacter lacus]